MKNYGFIRTAAAVPSVKVADVIYNAAEICRLAGEAFEKEVGDNFVEEYKALAGDLNVCSKRGMSERFDSTIGVGTVLMPFGGKFQRTPIQAMVHKVSVEEKLKISQNNTLIGILLIKLELTKEDTPYFNMISKSI